MLIRTFEFRLIIRVLILAATIVLFAFLIFKREFIFAAAAVALLGVYQIYSLISFTAKTNRDLSRFLLSIKYDDISQAFTSEGLGSSFSELKEAFNQVIGKLRETRSDMEVHARYLNTIIQHVGIGLLAYKPDGTVALINNAAKKLFKVAGLNDINSMKQANPELVDSLLSLKHGDKKLLKFHREGETGYLSISAHTFLLREEKYILISIQNIQAELEEKEMEAWQNLIRVLTHEIMNSITPISSMTAALLDMLDTGDTKNNQAVDGIGREGLEEMTEALKTIHQRSQGLMNFVNSYRNMALIPKPKFTLLSISDFFKRMEKLMSHKLTDNGIAFRWSVEPETLELTADPDLMEQVLINLLFNAIHAVSGRANPRIALSAFLSPESKIIISVEDNGVGIVEEALEKIFIPFFTTKKQGSGIGLSLSRQILHLHNATINAKSIPDQGTIFTVRFG
jgi:two-component system, NtrC family, nitrogen regulation sensor histidine kinase NtrY